MNRKISKRDFIKQVCLASAGTLCVYDAARAIPFSKDGLWKWSKEGMHYEVTPRGVMCLTCPNQCILREGELSVCRSRINYKNKLYSIAYGNPCAIHVDPIEKKPFYHFMPGSRSFSVAEAGCNFSCLNCQNWSISQSGPRETRNYELMPPGVSLQAQKNDCISVAYTYSEPVTFYEYVYDSANIARQKGLKNVLISNGYINEKPLRKLCTVIDAATIDIKGFDETTYVKLTAGELQPVLNSLKIYKQEGVWLEISNLVVPSWSDNMDMIKRMCDWLYTNGFEDTPLHFLRFQPMYKLNHLPPTPVSTLEKAKELARQAGLKYIYIGNIASSAAISTYCPRCKKMIVERKGHTVLQNHIKNGNCGFCGEKIPGRWNQA